MCRLLFNVVKIIIHVTHRAHAVEGSSQIYLIDNGVIKASGTHDSLLQTSEEYRTMFLSQIK